MSIEGAWTHTTVTYIYHLFCGGRPSEREATAYFHAICDVLCPARLPYLVRKHRGGVDGMGTQPNSSCVVAIGVLISRILSGGGRGASPQIPSSR